MKRILFVCTGNTCRSPMAEAIFNSKNTNTEYIADSAALSPYGGNPVSEYSKIVLSEIGIDIDHVSKTVTKELLEKSSVIFGITGEHASMLKLAYPEFSEKIFAFPYRIDDPYAQDIKVYRECRDMISDGIDLILQKLR